MKTKKAGSAGRFGPRYGRKIRSRVAEIESSSRARHVCPDCLRKTLKRQAAGIWHCRKCGVTFAGGAYKPTTAATKLVRQALARHER